jgi:hypothetical protein
MIVVSRTPSRHASQPRLSRRRAVSNLGGLLAAGALASHPVRLFAQEATPAPLARFAGETFVGETSQPDTFVAVVLGAGEEARGYLCDILGRGIEVWLTGTVADDRLALTAADGSVLTGVVNGAGVGGVATLPDERTLVFTALPATKIAGLYTVAVLPDGRLDGVSSGGATLVGALRAEGASPEERTVFDATLTTPEGESVGVTIGTATTEAGAFRTIVLPDGRSRGQGKTKEGQVMDPGMDFNRGQVMDPDHDFQR